MTEGRRGQRVPVLTLPDLRELKSCRAGQRVSFQARVLRVWEVGGQRMCLVGDASALTRVELGDAAVVAGRSYEFRDALVREIPARRPGAPPWHSAALAEGGRALELAVTTPISQSEEYIERTYRILAGIQTKKARQEGRVGPWRHPAKRRG